MPVVVGTYGAVDRIVAMQDFGWPLSRTNPACEDWRPISTATLGNPFTEEPWKKHFPLRLSVIGKQKCGVACNPAQFRYIMEQLGIKSKTPYILDKRTNEDFIAKRKPALPGHPGSWSKENALALANSNSRAQEAADYPRP